MGGKKARRLAWSLILPLGLVLGWGLAGPALAAGQKKAFGPDEDPAVLQRELDSLRVTYKDDHPDVIRARRTLEKALEKRRQAAEAAAKARPAPAASGAGEAPEGAQKR